MVFPDQEADLGAVDPAHKIVGYAMRDGEQVPFAMAPSDIEPA